MLEQFVQLRVIWLESQHRALALLCDHTDTPAV